MVLGSPSSRSLVWLAVAFVAAIVEVSIPHFGFGVRQPRRHRRGGRGVLRLRRPGADRHVRRRPGGVAGHAAIAAGRPARRARRAVAHRAADRPPRPGHARHRSDVGTGRVNVGGEDWAARSREPIAAGTKVRVVGADGIVLEVTRA